MDRVTTRTDPLLHPETYTYDNNGNPTQGTDRKSQVTSRTYDALDRLSAVTYQDGSTTTYAWDAGNRPTQLVDSLSGNITRTYDLLDRLTEEGTPEGTVSYTYDTAGRRASMTALGQPQVAYTYDNADRLTQITQGTSTVGFTYDNANRRTSLTLPNGVVTEYSYDAASRLTGLTYKNGPTVLGTLTYAYDAAGNRTTLGGTWAATGIPQPVSSATYNAGNQQLTFGGQTLSYDANGNLTSDGVNTYTWDTRNRLVALDGTSTTATFSYDALGRRQSTIVNGTTTQFLFDGLNPVQEIGVGTTATLLTGLGIDEYLTRTDQAGTRSLLTDALGSTVALTDATGTVQTLYTYEPFGTATATGSDANPFQFTGRENDGTELYYYRARYYHPGLQRFISEYPIQYAGGMNLFVYVENAPTGFVDPGGLDKQDTWQSGGGQSPEVILVAAAAQAGQTCVGSARVLRGRPALVGRQGGFPGVRVQAGTAAIIPDQFGLTVRQLRPYVGSISGTVAAGSVSFSSITDVIGGRSPIPGVNVRDALQRLNPNTFIIELVSVNRDLGVVDIELNLPAGLSCPTGTRPR